MARLRNLIGLSLIAALSIPKDAQATWEWPEEVTDQHWRSITLTWARAIHPDPPSRIDLAENFEPPTEELWCHDPAEPVQFDCDMQADLLDDWIRVYLDLGANDPIPSDVDPFPPGCSSICYP